MIPTLRHYQVDANNEVVSAAANGAQVIVLQMPTGAGKTNSACDLVGRAAAKGKNVVVIAHRRKLVDQFSERLDQFEVDHGVFMRGRPYTKDTYVQVTSKDTLISRCVENEWKDMPDADLLIVDEGRHCIAGEAYRKVVDHYRRQGSRIVLLDATPVLADGRGLGPYAQAMVIGAKVTDLIRDEYLLPVKCIVPDRKGKNKKKKRGIAGDLVESWKEFACGMPTVLFTSRVAFSEEAADTFRDNGIKAIHVDAETPDDEREQIFDGVEDGTYQVICNVGILGEGVDLPCLGCCQLYMDPSSRTRFLQQAGRIMRPHAGQQFGVLIDHAGAVFRHGFPDEDTDWTLDGNVDTAFAEKHKKGLTDKASYCAICQIAYHNSATCPQCGRLPEKIPPSIFAPDPLECTNENLVEADRNTARPEIGRQERVDHWFRCLRVAKKRDGTMGMAAQIYKSKYKTWPGTDFPYIVSGAGWKQKLTEVFPDFGKKKEMF